MRFRGPDHIVLVSPEPERLVAWYTDVLGLEVLRLEEWRRQEVLFVSLRVSDTFLIDVLQGERTGTNVDHLALCVDEVDVDELAASGRFEVAMGPADLFGAQGDGRGFYTRDPDGNLLEPHVLTGATVPAEGHRKGTGMTLQVVGAGVGRTGTHSLKVALEQLLGGRCHHMIEVFPSEEQKAGWGDACYGKPVDWPALLADFTAIVDWPGGAFWPELTAAYPEALVLLSTRTAEDWYRSASNTIFTGISRQVDAGDPWMTAFMHMMSERFSAEVDDPEAMMAAFEAHNARVRAAVPADRLLEWTAADGWDPICERLGMPVPDEPFPRTNTTDEFREMLGLPPADA